MKLFSERNPVTIGLIGIALLTGTAVAILNYHKLPLINHDKHYSAYFAEAGGLTSGASVQVSGSPVGQVDSIALDGSRVLVTFTISNTLRIGDRTEAAVKTKSLLGNKFLEIRPRGDGRQQGPIPLERTTSAYQLPDAMGDLSAAISGLNTDQLSQSLDVLATTFRDTPPDVQAAVAGVARFSEVLNTRDTQLRTLLANANKTSTVLAERGDQIAGLIKNTNDLLVALQSQSAALDQVSANIAAAANQIRGLIDDTKQTFRPSLDKLNGVLALVENRKSDVQKAIRGLNTYALSLGESVGSGPFFKAYIANLIPGQILQPFIDAAFSDLGLDPNVLLPSQRVDPPVGQPGTPALPIPYPRTGQGGEPNMTLPDAITGKPGDARYPYREPLPAPTPGGPPPGPPAPAAPGVASTPTPEPTSIELPAAPPQPPLPAPPAGSGTQGGR
ncbi:MCE family protein [Mycolicibacterium alvei]|uniref:Mammalian cell entry protein n=1 Tax=Mycolicibacterium alvei TaxID=67081 RepID=A0A6N4UW03_9MYCO|nr:MCE family protein [Mycolicibacterium alvei]MCV7003942.1 MCE family protein [Mycolicibacterium alvei]BBX27701.1 mammalian cell entry protein [Mycolicibacterium alvei]